MIAAHDLNQLHRPLLERARELTGNHHDAEDLLQDTMVKLVRKEPEYRGFAPLLRWCRTTMLRIWIDQARERG